MYLGPEMSDTKAPAAHGAVEDEGRASTGSVRRQCALAKAETFMPSLDMTPDRPSDGTLLTFVVRHLPPLAAHVPACRTVNSTYTWRKKGTLTVQGFARDFQAPRAGRYR